jgi:type IV secretory pathway VirJ component
MERRRVRRGLVATALVLSSVGALMLAQIGVFGGDLYTQVPARRAAAPGQRDVAALLFSGDMGFRVGMGPGVSARLSEAGLPVIGVSSMIQFRDRHTPAQIGTFVADAIRHALGVTGARRLILVGQSFGADMLHIGLIRLPPDLRARVALVLLVVPTDTVYYQISPGEMLEWSKPDADALETARKLDWVPTLCVQGVEETNSLCPLLTQANVERVALPGGHRLHHDADRLSVVLLRKIDAVVPPR